MNEYKKLVAGYMRDVERGRIPAGKLIQHAVQRQRRDLRDGAKRGLLFNETKAAAACDFFPKFLEHTDGEYNGMPFELLPPQAFIVWTLFGWTFAKTGYRRFRRAFISMGRGGGKSPLAAGLVLLPFAFDSPIESRAEGFCFATKRDQAAIVFRQCKRYVLRNSHLRRHCEVLKYAIHVPSTDSCLQPLGSDSDNTDGLVPQVVVVDELHAWKAHYRELWEKIETAMGKRRQDLLCVITTAGSEQSIVWRSEYDFAVNVVTPNGFNDDGLAVFIWEMDDGDSEFAERSWHKANPLMRYGVTRREKIEQLAAKAKVSKASLASLRRFYCNRFTESTSKPITTELWAKGDRPLPDLAGRLVFGGFDWGWRDDLAALAWVFPLQPVDIQGTRKRRYAIDVDAWIPAGGARDLSREPWSGWISDGWLQVTDGDTTDPDAVYSALAERRERHRIGSIALDPHNAIEFSTRVQNEFGIEVFEFQQTYSKYNNPIREFLQALQEGRIDHGGNPLLGWAATNLVTRMNAAEYLRPDKQTSAEKIDPIVAVLMAFSEAMVAEIFRRSFYEDHDLEEI